MNALQHVEAARALHAHVRHHQVVAPVAASRALDRAGPVVDRVDFVAVRPQDLAQQIARDPIVLGHQHPGRGAHARPAAPAARARGSAAGGGGRPLARDADEEGRALARLALDGDRAAERGGELAADGEAEARPLAAPLGRVEGLEDSAQVVGGDAVAGIADGDEHVVADRLRASTPMRPPTATASRAFDSRFTTICRSRPGSVTTSPSAGSALQVTATRRLGAMPCTSSTASSSSVGSAVGWRSGSSGRVESR